MLSQKIILNPAAIIILAVLFSACQPGALTKKEPAPSHVDSVLFFEQNEVSDPFLESLKTENDREIVLHTTLLPPPALPQPDYREADGFRVQVFAGLDSLNARAITSQLESTGGEPVYLVREDGLYKVQTGDFLYRADADNRNMVLRREGFPGAWVVSRKIRLPAEAAEAPAGSVQTDATAVPDETDMPEPAEEVSEAVPFRIRVLATSDMIRAGQIAAELEQTFAQPAYYEEKNGLYKVYLGKFSDRPAAESVLKEVRENGYPDAWLVY